MVMTHISDETIAEVRAVSEANAAREAKEATYVDAVQAVRKEGSDAGVDLIVAIMEQSRADLEYTNTLLIRSGFAAALAVIDEYIHFYRQVVLSADTVTTRKLEWALDEVSLPWLMERKAHFEDMVAKMDGTSENGF